MPPGRDVVKRDQQCAQHGGNSVGALRAVPGKGIVFSLSCRGFSRLKTSVGLQHSEGFATMAGFPGPNVATFTFLYPGKLRDDPGKH